MASVRRRDPKDPKSKWVVEYTNPATGQRVRATPKTGLKKDADALRRKIESEIESAVHVTASQTLTFRQGFDLYFEDCLRRQKIGDLAGATVASTKYMLGLLLPHLGKMKLSDLTIEVVQARFDVLSATYSPTTLKDLRSVLRTFLRFMVRRKAVKRNILVDDTLTLPKRRNTKPKMPDKDQIAAILRALDRRDPTEHFQSYHCRRVVVCLGLFCGLRRGEIAGLQWENVDLGAGMIRVRNSLSAYDGLKGTKTHAGERDIPMPDIVRSALMTLLAFWQVQLRFDADPRNHEYKKRLYREKLEAPPAPDADQRPCGFVVTTRTGQPVAIENMSKDFVRVVMMKAGLPAEAYNRLGLHSLRHAFVSLLIEDGIAPMSLRKLVGHQSLTTTYNVYAHLFPQDQAERLSVERIASAFKATETRLIPLSH